jgi:heme/copper-type cytochrome/quinol oxidase subunit 4
MDNNNSSGINTALLVIILVVVVGGLVWFFTNADQNPADAQLDADGSLPSAENSL